MHSLLKRLLEKRNITDINVLAPEEKQTYDDWNRVLSEGTISVEKIKIFCENQTKQIQGQWKDVNNSTQKNERLIIMHTIYSTLLNIIDAPSKEKENLEKFLTSLVSEKSN